MKSVLYTILSAAILSTAVSCKDKSSSTCVDVNISIPERDSVALKNYITNNSINAEYDSRGFYYKIQNQGSSKKPSQCATIMIDYSGKLVNGTVFDSNNNQTFSLLSLISGWRMGMPLVGEGGEIILYLPPALGYGDEDNGPIPGGSITIFTIKLHSITKD
ncbi:putative FKBP-type peptidyl-prolyl cis-trans isomerase FkpA precursor [compost metagenome]